MPTLRALDGTLITLADGPRALASRVHPTRDLELGGTDTRDLILSCPPLPDQTLGTVTARLAPPFMAALHAAIDGGTSADIIDLASLLADVAREDAR